MWAQWLRAEYASLDRLGDTISTKDPSKFQCKASILSRSRFNNFMTCLHQCQGLLFGYPSPPSDSMKVLLHIVQGQAYQFKCIRLRHLTDKMQIYDQFKSIYFVFAFVIFDLMAKEHIVHSEVHHGQQQVANEK